MLEAPPALTDVEALEEILAAGYTLGVRVRTEVSEAHGGAHAITYADKLQILGDAPLPPELRSLASMHRDALLAAACILRPPVPWIRLLVERYHSRYEVEVRRSGWKGSYRVRLGMIAANVAAFIGLHPAHDGPRLEAIIAEALR